MTDEARPAISDQQLLRRMLLLNLVLPLLMAVVTALGLVALVLHLLASAQKVDHSSRILSQLATLQRLVIDSETGLRGYLLTSDRVFLDPKIRADQELAVRVPELRQLIGNNPTQLARLARFEAQRKAWLDYFDEITRLRHSGGDTIPVVKSQRGKALVDEMRAICTDLQDAEEKLRDDYNQQTRETTRLVLTLGIAFLALLGVLLALGGRRQLMMLAERFRSAIALQKDQTAKLARSNWVRTGQARLADEFRGAADVRAVTHRSLTFLAKYTGASVGRLFVLQEHGGFSAMAAYALDDRGLEVRAEGWVLQAAHEARLVTLPELPPDYLKVQSGLGATPVTYVVLAPALYEGAACAIVELGFLKAPPEEVVELLGLVAQKLGAAITSAQSRARLHELLDETQRQAEELQSQQEELEANNEDLQQKGQELLAQQFNLEQVNEELQHQQALLEEQRERLEVANEELRRAQDESQERAKSLETAGRYKSEFLANMSHELRTPLNSILLLSNLLTESGTSTMTAEELEYATTIHASATDLLTLINDILDLSKVEAGKLDLSPLTTHPSDLIPSLDRMFRPAMAKKGLAFEITVAEDAPPSIVTDRTRCEQVLRNFLSNALKFTDKGSVTLAFSRAPNAPYALAIEVRDTGIGIPAAKQALVFEAFQQADGTISRRFGGTGLGLTICRELALLLGAKVELESREGVGSTFRLLLPPTIASGAAKEPEVIAAPEATPGEPVAERKVRLELGGHDISDDRTSLTPGESFMLVIEDDPTYAKAFCKLCRRKGFRCLIAADGETGLAEAIHFAPTAIILDLNLPGVSGLAVLDALKRNPRTRHIPVHVVSVESTGRDVLKRGAVGFRTKPIDEDSIAQLIDDVMRKGTSDTKRLLVIEDNKVEQENIRRLIGNDDVVTEIVGNGRDALARLQEANYDCVILDLKLPDMSGFEFLAELEKLALLRKPPVIVYTARDLTPAEQTKLAEASQSIVLKGARSPERLLDELTLFLHKMEDKLSPVQREMLQRVRHRDELFGGKKLLIVDDDMRNVFALRSVLLARGFEVLVAKSGKEALERLAQTPEVDVVLMDVMMPEMDGYEAIRAIRQEERFRHTPIIALTAKAMKGDRQRCLDAGANDYLPKPVELPSLLSLLRIWLSQ